MDELRLRIDDLDQHTVRIGGQQVSADLDGLVAGLLELRLHSRTAPQTGILLAALRQMGRPLRRHAPGQYYLVTTRCHQARFFLRPDRRLNDTVLEWLARAQRAFPNLRLHAVCVMSNHLHLVVHDRNGELAAWASFFLGNLARAVNRIRKRSGSFFERRYSAEPILDNDALIDRLIYVVTNPVKAALCKRVSEWPGIVLWSEEGVAFERGISWIDRDAQRRATSTPRDGGQPLIVPGRIRIDPLPGDGGSPLNLAETIRVREQELANEHRAERRKTLTKARVLAQRWHAAPRRPKRTPRPLCHASDPALRRAFTEGFREFTALFRDASEQLRSRAASAHFPDWCYPPGRPLLRPTLAT